MQEGDAPDLELIEERPTLSSLFGQLAEDSSAFARAEIAFLRTQAGERANYALPGLLLIAGAVALGLGAIVALLVMISFWLATKIKTLLAIVIVFVVAALMAVLLAKLGAARLRGALKARDDR